MAQFWRGALYKNALFIKHNYSSYFVFFIVEKANPSKQLFAYRLQISPDRNMKVNRLKVKANVSYIHILYDYCAVIHAYLNNYMLLLYTAISQALADSITSITSVDGRVFKFGGFALLSHEPLETGRIGTYDFMRWNIQYTVEFEEIALVEVL